MYGVLGSMPSRLSTRLPVSSRRTGPSLSVKAAGLTGSLTKDAATDAEDEVGVAETLALAKTLGTADVLCGEKTNLSHRVSLKPNSAILGRIAPPWRSVMRTRIEISPANLPKMDA